MAFSLTNDSREDHKLLNQNIKEAALDTQKVLDSSVLRQTAEVTGCLSSKGNYHSIYKTTSHLVK